MSTPATLEVLLKEAQWLRRLAVHLVDDPDEAADIVQETWIKAMRSRPDADRPLKGWLGRVALNLVRQRARAKGRRHRHEAAAGEAPAAPVPLADVVLERMELQRIVAEQVMSLEEPLRSTVCLHYYEGLTSVQVGEAMGQPEGTVRWRLKEARERLRAELDRRCNGKRQAWAAVLAPGAWAAKAPAAEVAATSTGKTVAGVALLGVLVVAGVVVLARRGGPVETARGYVWTPPVGASLKVFGAPAPAPAGALSGVVKQADGQSAAGVVVTARRRQGREGRLPAATTVSSASGAFAFTALADGTYDLTATSSEALSASAGALIVRDGGALRDVVLTLGAGGFLLSGRLLDAGGGALPSGVLQAHADEAVFTAHADAQGQYRLRLAKNNYRLEADADGYAVRTGSVGLVGDMVRDFRLDPAGRLVGSVVDGESGKPVARAIVRAEAGERPPIVAHTTSDEQGRFSFGDLAPAEYVVSARAGARAGFRSGHLAVPVAGEVDAGKVALAAAYEIEGRVLGGDGRPVSGASVRVDDVLFDQGAFGGVPLATSGPDGRYRIEGVAPGRLRVRAGGVLPCAPSPSAFVTIKDASVRQDFTLPVAGTVRGQVLGPDGTAAPAAVVMVTTRDSANMDAPFRGAGRMVTDDRGRFTIAGLGAGVVEIEIIDKRWGRLQDRQLRLAAGETKEATFTFPAPATVAGVVSWDAGGPAAGVRVRWIPFGRGGREPETITDRAGRFQLGPCSPGPGVVQAELPTDGRMTGGMLGPHKRKLDLTAAAAVTGVELRLDRNDKSIAGLVLDPAGHPLADATVGVEEDHGQGAAVDHRSENMVRTDAEGRFLLEHLTRGRYVLWATHADYPAAERPGVEASSAGNKLRFSAGATLSGTVKDERGAPARIYTLVLVSPEGPGHTNGFGSGRLIGREEKVNDDRGAFSIGRVAPGRYDLLVTAADGRVARAASLTVSAGERKSGLDLVLRRSVTLNGKVLDSETRAPLAGARVVVMGTREHVHATSDATGAFALTGQIPGRTVLVHVVAAGEYGPNVREISVPDRDAADLRPFRMTPARAMGREALEGTRPTGEPGLRVADREEGLVVEEVTPGSPASRQGLQPGDRILAIGGRDMAGIGTWVSATLLRGPSGSTVEITLAGPGGAPRTVTLERSATRPVMATRR